MEQIPSHQTYAETFVGGGQVFFCKERAKRSLLNDIDPDLIATYIIIRDRPLELIKALQNEEISKERHKYYKTLDPKDELQQAIRWYYLNRTSFSGILSEGCCYLGYREGISVPPSGWGKMILEASHHLREANVKITCLDFEEAIAMYDGDTFAFVDPPYFAAARNLYNYDFQPEDHERLARTLYDNRYNFKFLLTYDDSQEIRKLYKWADISQHSWRYSLRYDLEESNEAKEIFINNYYV